ncbi:MAG: hypothetical protein IJE97_07145, partial [Thermoguttaceae bacterium]|nr:hypothetical protein [Thermoguttaceae bacterium]
MNRQSNALERNRKIVLLVEHFLKLNVVGDAKFLRQFTLDDSLELAYLDHEETRRLAHALIVAEYQALRARGDDVSIESQAQTYCELFAQRKFELDRAELLKRLVQRELHCVPDTPLLTTGLDDLKRRFPEIADFFDQYFERRRNAVYSCSAARFPTSADDSKAPPTVVSTSERYEVALTPVAPESGSALGKLGAGGLKDVYAARQASTDQTVALKILKHSESS